MTAICANYCGKIENLMRDKISLCELFICSVQVATGKWLQYSIVLYSLYTLHSVLWQRFISFCNWFLLMPRVAVFGVLGPARGQHQQTFLFQQNWLRVQLGEETRSDPINWYQIKLRWWWKQFMRIHASYSLYCCTMVVEPPIDDFGPELGIKQY